MLVPVCILSASEFDIQNKLVTHINCKVARVLSLQDKQETLVCSQTHKWWWDGTSHNVVHIETLSVGVCGW